MKLNRRLGLSAATAAILWSAPAAHAAGVDRTVPANTITFSAQTVAANANKVTIPSGAIVYQSVSALNGAAPASTITIFAPPGATFTAAPIVDQNSSCGAFIAPGVLNAGGASVTYTFAAAGTCSTPPAESSLFALQAATLANVPDLATPGNEVSITARAVFAPPGTNTATDEPNPIPILTLRAANTFEFSDLPLSPALTINLAGTGGSTPGTQFDNGAGGVSPAGFLGTVTVHARQDIDAATGMVLAAAPTGTLNATVSGNFFSISQAYLTVNPANPQASCVSPAPAGSGPGVINATNTAITFNPPLPTAFPAPGATTTWAVCIISGATVGGAAVQIPVTPVTITAIIKVMTTNFTVANNEGFGRIAANGSAAYFQNVFGQANGYPTFFRVANPTSVNAPVFAILTRDGIAAQFMGALTAVPGNNAMFFSADTVAGAVGTTLVAGPLHATVRLLSPTASVLFSAVSQNATTLDISALP